MRLVCAVQGRWRTCKCVCITRRVVVLAHSHHSFTGDQIRCSSPEPREPATGSCWPCQVDEPPAMQQQHQTSAIPPNQQIKILVETRSVRQNKLKHSTARWFSAGGIQVHTAHSLAPRHARRKPEKRQRHGSRVSSLLHHHKNYHKLRQMHHEIVILHRSSCSLLSNRAALSRRCQPHRRS